MSWTEFHRAVAEHGLTFAQSPAHFGFGGISGTVLSIAPYDPDEDQPPVEREIVTVDDFRDESRDAILDAAEAMLKRVTDS